MPGQSVLNNKYAEGYPGRRYYGGCEYVDIAEQLAIDRAKALFGAEHANVQPHAGAQANAAVYHALLNPGDRMMGLELSHGGHLTHGMKINVSGRLYDVVAYHVDRDTSLIDMDEVQRLAEEHRPKLIVAGWSAYPRQLDFARFREIADSVGALLVVDMAHFAGLVAAGLHPSPVPYRRRGHDHDPQDDRRRSRRHDPLQGGVRQEDRLGGVPRPAGRAAGAHHRRQGGGAEDRRLRCRSASARSGRWPARERSREELLGAGGGVSVLTGGTDVHLVLCDLRESELDGKQAEDRLHSIGITVNRNAVPFDPRPPAVSSGLRIGSPALATRGLQVDDFVEVGKIIATTLNPGGPFEALQDDLRERVTAIADRYPLYAGLATASV